MQKKVEVRFRPGRVKDRLVGVILCAFHMFLISQSGFRPRSVRNDKFGLQKSFFPLKKINFTLEGRKSASPSVTFFTFHGNIY